MSRAATELAYDELNEIDENSALNELESILEPRLHDAQNGNVVNESVESIFKRVRERKLEQ